MYDEWRQEPSARLTVSLQEETYDYVDNASGAVERRKTGRQRLVVEGERSFVEAICAAAADAIEEAAREIGHSIRWPFGRREGT